MDLLLSHELDRACSQRNVQDPVKADDHVHQAMSRNVTVQDIRSLRPNVHSHPVSIPHSYHLGRLHPSKHLNGQHIPYHEQSAIHRRAGFFHLEPQSSSSLSSSGCRRLPPGP